MASVQLNVRLDANLKSAGDAVLERCGASAVQVVRAAWQYMADHQRLPDYACPEAASAQGETPAPEALSSGMAMRLAREAGLRAELESMSYADLRETAYEEMLLEEAERRA